MDTDKQQDERGLAFQSNALKTQTVSVAVYDSHAEAEEAIKTLQRSGFDMKSLSIVGKDYQTEEQALGFYNTGDRMKVWGRTGAFWGGIFGFMFGSAMFLVPGIGALIVAGPLVGWIVAGLEGAAVIGGLSALGGALSGIGIPRDSVVRYETQIKAGKFLVVARGTADQASTARTILSVGATESAFHQS
jgi:uncharacterized membrane protein